ncbi:DUF397 domain-containing protein [Streptomyces sioyaensis]|uniref:DUF397 domain-containing protein n=1 Tax=Streptomyces sioyaensis TaxID=67364 RepID=A0A4Q1QRS9_9ACTN|nr:DUF397 domain-containing protein [Streptomyces sioyaensis]MBM4795065.1 DUF397 domain-containing protein [Streptomyces sioyaensis]RXS59399.1 DUF397 domain-containing protein [Streptomyces sioyaensis]
MTLKPSGGNSSALAWIKSSYSSSDGPECVEVATTPDTILIRDSKNPDGPRLTFTPTTWADFLPYAAMR